MTSETGINPLPSGAFGIVDGTRARITGTGLQNTTDAAREEAEELSEQFLQLLLTQLENQNPLDPVDTTEYTGQLVQYSALEQQISTNTKLDELRDLMSVQTSFSAFSYVGNTADLDTNTSVLQDGSIEWNYALDDNATDVVLKVRDQNGVLVYEERPGEQSLGIYNFTLNQEDALSPVEEGQVLSFVVEAVDTDQVPVQVDIQTNVVIDSVETNGTGIVLRAGELYFSPDDIGRLRATSEEQTPNPSTQEESTS